MNKKIITILCVILSVGLLTGCAKEDAKKQESYKELGLTAMSEGDYEKAIESFNKALKLANGSVDNQEIDICYYKAAAQYQAGDFGGAVDTYTALMEYDEGDPMPIFLRGSIYANENQMEQALKDYKSAVKCDEEDYELYIQIFENLQELNHRDEGLEFLNLALEIEGNKAENYMQRGRIYLILEQYDAATKALNKAIDKNLDEAKVYLAQVYLAQDEDDKAEATLEEYIKNDTVTSDALNIIGCMKMEQGDYEAALKYFKQGLGLDKVADKKSLMKNEIAALEHTGEFDTASEKLEEYLKEYPTDEEAIREKEFLATR